MARELPTRRNRENAGGLGENPLALTIPYVARLLDNFAGGVSCLRSRQRLRLQEGQKPDADLRALSVEADGFFDLPEWDNKPLGRINHESLKYRSSCRIVGSRAWLDCPGIGP
jgi:hypothetical protein